LFWCADGVEQAWRVVDPMLVESERVPPGGMSLYEPGRWGPDEAGAFIRRENRRWVESEAPAPSSPSPRSAG
jgi:glucose-6-phosphate 1-dehydrogenase